MRPAILASLVFFALSSAAQAADLSVSVLDAGGRPVPNAVVTLKAAGAQAAPIRFTWPYSVSQRNVQFDPFVLIVPVGSDVTFPNRDAVRHHVYSFSPVKKFELKLYGKEEARSVRFDKAGVVPLGCNIHDQMIAYIYVVGTPYAARTGTDGVATLRGLPAGAGQMTVWHPLMKTAGNQMVKPVSVAAAGARASVSVDLRPSPANHPH